MLYERGHFRFDKQGRKTYTYQVQYRIMSASGLEGWSTVSADWSPWFQDRPKITVRITGRDGRISKLDPASVVEVPVDAQHPDLYSDRRRVRAPLPGIEVGATVEQTIVYQDVKPFFEAGSLAVFYFGMRVPVAQSQVTVEVPQELPFRFEVVGLELEPQEEKKGGVRTLRFDAGLLPPILPADRWLPPEAVRYPHLVMSTAPSWAAIAKAYTRAVEARIQGADVSSLTRGLRSPKTEAERRKLIGRLLMRLHERVRYTGIEFGKQAIIPWKPAQTLERKFGDCKDKAAVLVSMLRSFGIQAHLALLRSGSGADVRPKLPGLEAFNHAIVYVPAKPGVPELWIDATADLAALGQLPLPVQGRSALIATAGTKGLVRIPASDPKDNRYLEQRTYVLADRGPMRITERTSATGAMELKLREQFARARAQEIRRSLSRYVRSSYRAERLSDFRLTSPQDVHQPFSISIAADEAKVGFTSSSEARLQLKTGILFSWLPEIIRMAALAEDKEKQIERVAARRMIERRTEDMVWPQPYRAEVHFSVTPPMGYELRSLPEDIREVMGPAEFSASFRLGAKGVVEARFLFDIGKRRYSSDETRALVQGLRAAWDMPVTSLRFDHRGSKHLAQGRVREGLAEYRALAERHPKSPLHQARLAEALLKAGLGGPARQSARRAVALDPTSTYALFAQGWVMQHDLFGRLHNNGFAREAAISALQKVKLLDESHLEARFALATLYEHDQEGNRFVDQEELKKAIAEYRALRKVSEQKKEVDERLIFALYWADDFEGIIELAEKMEPSLKRDAMLMTALCAVKGVPAAVLKFGEKALAPELQQKVSEAAATFLAHKRLYPQALKLSQEIANGAEDPVALQSRMAMLSRLERFETKRLPKDNPARPVQQILTFLFSGKAEARDLRDVMAKGSFKDGSVEEELEGLEAAYAGFRRAVRKSGVPLSMIRDNVLSQTRFRQEGNDRTGYRIRSELLTPKGQQTSWWFVVREGKTYKLRASESAPAGLGAQALTLIEQGKLNAARQWLDWAYGLIEARPDQDALTTRPFAALWPPGGERDRRSALVAAAALVAEGRDAKRAVRILERSKLKGRRVLHRNHALAIAYLRSGALERMLRISQELTREAPNSVKAYILRFRALYGLGRFKEARRIAQRRLVSQRDDRLALNQLADLAIASGDFLEARRKLKRIIDLGAASSSTYNNLAWLALFAPPISEADISASLQANTMTQFNNPSSLHTLAALYAEQGKTREAFQLVLKRMELRNADEPADVDWYLLGRIMEHYQLNKEAIHAYEKVAAPQTKRFDSTYTLAKRRLDLLRSAGRL